MRPISCQRLRLRAQRARAASSSSSSASSPTTRPRSACALGARCGRASRPRPRACAAPARLARAGSQRRLAESAKTAIASSPEFGDEQAAAVGGDLTSTGAVPMPCGRSTESVRSTSSFSVSITAIRSWSVTAT